MACVARANSIPVTDGSADVGTDLSLLDALHRGSEAAPAFGRRRQGKAPGDRRSPMSIERSRLPSLEARRADIDAELRRSQSALNALQVRIQRDADAAGRSGR